MKSAHPEFMSKRCSRISPPWKWMYPQVSLLLTSRGWAWGGGGRNGASSQTTCWELTQLDPQFVKVSSKNDGYLQKGHDELTDHERFGVYRKETFQRGYWFDCIAIICNNKLQLSCLKLGGSILGWFKHMSYMSIINQPSMHFFIKDSAYRRLPRINTVMGPGRREMSLPQQIVEAAVARDEHQETNSDRDETRSFCWKLFILATLDHLWSL